MSVSNLDYLYDNLPARTRRDDEGLFLKRFLSVIGGELDGFDQKYDTFYQMIDPETAPPEFINWWLFAFFGWGWFPKWFTLPRRRVFYAAIASQHYPERGTLRGIKNFLNAFGLRAIVEGGPRFFDDGEVYGESGWSCPGPMVIIVRLFPQAPAVPEDGAFFSEAAYGDDYFGTPGESIQIADVDALLRFVWPLSQSLFVENLRFRSPAEFRAITTPGYGLGEYGEIEFGG
jgi:phage tail-like protein